MKPEQLEILLQEGEGTMLDYKESLSASFASFARERVALANTPGGRILLGVRDDGSVSGVKDSNGLRARIQDIARNCDPPVQVLIEPVGNVLIGMDKVHILDRKDFDGGVVADPCVTQLPG